MMLQAKTMNHRFLIPLVSILLLSGCIQTEEGKASFAIALIIFLIILSIASSLFLNLFSFGLINRPIRTIVTSFLLVLGSIFHPAIGLMLALIGYFVALKSRKEKPVKGMARKILSWIGLFIAGLSILASIVLIIVVIANYFRCSGGCENVLGESLFAVLLSLIPGMIGYLRIRYSFQGLMSG